MTKGQDAVLGYNVSKKLAEKAAWNFVEENKTAFDLTVINPDVVIGPMLHPVAGPRSVNESNRFVIYNFMDGTYEIIGSVRFPFYHFVSLNLSPTYEEMSSHTTSCQVDVRDVAKAHVLALTAPNASNKRILLVSELVTPQLVVNTIRNAFQISGRGLPKETHLRSCPKA